MKRLLLAIIVGITPALAGAAPHGTYDKLTKAELGKMTGRQAGSSSANLERFMQNREPIVQKHFGLFVGLAKRMLAAAPDKLRNPSTKQADQLFDKLAKGRLGTDIPDDYCFMRAEIAARILEAQGFAVKKINAIASGGKTLEENTKNTVDKKVTWSYHVAPLVEAGKTEYVLDPSTGNRKMTLRGWKAKMHDAGMETLVTSADQLNYSAKPAATHDERVHQLATALAELGGIREYERFRKQALDKRATR